MKPPIARPYSERVIHGCIYQARSDVMAVCHHHAAAVLPFCIAGRPIKPVFHLGAVIGDETPMRDQHDEFGDTNLLVVKPEEGRSLARALGQHSAVLMLRHGATVVGELVEGAGVALDLHLPKCRVSDARNALGSASPLHPGEIRQADVIHQKRAGVDRAWEYYCARLKESGGWPPKAKAKAARTKPRPAPASRSAAKKKRRR